MTYNPKQAIFNLNPLSSALFSLGFLAFSQTAYAACTSDPTDNNHIICEGDTVAPTPNLYSKTNKTLTNKGNISGNNEQDIVYASNSSRANYGTGGNTKVINEGSIVWENARHKSARTYRNIQIFSAVDLYYGAGSTPAENSINTVINEKTGIIKVTRDPFNQERSIAGILVSSRPGSAVVENKGKVSVSALFLSNPDIYTPAIQASGRNTSINNSGEIEVLGSMEVSGLVAHLTHATGIIDIKNSGNVVLQGNQDSRGITLFNSLNENLGDVSIDNSGVIKANNGTGIGIEYNKETKKTADINNSGTIELENGQAVISFVNKDINAPAYITNSGSLINHKAIDPLAIQTSIADDIFKQTAGETVGDIELNGGDDRFITSGGKLVGKTHLGRGNDYAELSNTEVTGVTVLNGADKAASELDTDESNTLVLNQDLTGSTTSVGEHNNTQIKNWNTVLLGRDQAGKLNLTGDLLSGLANNGLGDMTIGSQGTLALNAGTSAAELGYHLNNSGNIDLTQGSTAADSKLTINGNYQGDNGSTLTVKSTWNNPDVQANDQLVIQGTASGQTVVKVRNGTIDGDVIRDNIEKNGGWSNPVVVVEGGDGGNTVFTGTANTSSASQAQLARQEENGVAKYTWTLKAGEEYIYAKPVTGYVLQPYINSQMGLAQLGQLHQRVGEQYKNGLENKQVWGRLSLNNEDLQGVNRFGAKVRSGFVQFGKDVSFKLNEDQSHRHIGLTATYGWANSSFYDKYNAKNGEISADKFTGKSKTDMFSVGGYHTDYAADGWYVDKVAQVSWLRNHYKSEQDARQTGWGFGASVETGKAYPLKRNPNWAIEPQAQLSYQWVKLGNANDGMRRIESGSQHNLTARLGTRLTWNKSEKDNQAQAYLGANLIQTLMGRNSEVKIGQDRVQENMGGLLLALDLGGQYPLTKNLSVYGDVRYQISLDNHDSKLYRNSTLAREGYNGRVGLRYTW